MRDPLVFMQVEDVPVDRQETIANAPSFEQVMQEIGSIILVYLLLALAAELLTRWLAVG